jgi:hypothetical protein
MRGTHDQQPSMANLGLDSDGGHRYRFWNLAPPCRLPCDWLFLGCCFFAAWTAIRGLVPLSGQRSVRCHATLNFNMATASVVSRMSPRCRSLRSRNLSMALVARAMASRSCFCSLRITRIGSSNDQGNPIPPKAAGAILNFRIVAYSEVHIVFPQVLGRSRCLPIRAAANQTT